MSIPKIAAFINKKIKPPIGKAFQEGFFLKIFFLTFFHGFYYKEAEVVKNFNSSDL